ncbi:MAG: DUF4476 domain-containing protein [Deltaproteobacteria bacterium]|nr:DUF4476 domain-containing protein [Deltaproteobacteria bacterium]
MRTNLMSLFVLLSLMLTAVPALADHERRSSSFEGDTIVIDLDDLERQTVRQQRRMSRNLKQMRELAAQLPPCDARDELMATIAKSQRLLGRMKQTDQELVGLATIVNEPRRAEPRRDRRDRFDEPDRFEGPGYGYQGPVAVPEGEFATVLRAVRGETFDDDKMRMLRDVANYRFFDVGQTKRLVSLFTFSDAKVDAAAFLHSRIVDPENFYLVYSSLTFPSDKEALRRRVGA